MVQKINTLLAQSIGTLNALLVVVLVLGGLIGGVVATGPFLGPLAFVIGPIVGAAIAVSFCGLLAVLINIRDLLAELVQQQGQ